LRIEFADHAPDFVTLRVKENKSRREFETIDGGKFFADSLLNIQTDNVNWAANADLAIKFFFKLVNDGLYFGASNSEGGLKFKKYGCARADHCLYAFGIVHERRLARM
jgi:hypothetical protein